MSTRALLAVSALIELGTGVALLTIPSLIAEILLGNGLSSLESLALARIAGSALIAISVACWLARNGDCLALSGQVVALLIYNLAVPIVLIHGHFEYAFDGVGLWPATLMHSALGVWCGVCLWSNAGDSSLIKK